MHLNLHSFPSVYLTSKSLADAKRKISLLKSAKRTNWKTLGPTKQKWSNQCSICRSLFFRQLFTGEFYFPFFFNIPSYIISHFASTGLFFPPFFDFIFSLIFHGPRKQQTLARHRWVQRIFLALWSRNFRPLRSWSAVAVVVVVKSRSGAQKTAIH